MKKGRMMPYPVACAVCETVFETRHSQGKYCSPTCTRVGARKSWHKYAVINRDSRRAYGKDLYRADPQRVIERTSAYQKTPAGKAASRVTGIRQRAKNPEKISARTAVNHAVTSGKLIRQPCLRCSAAKAEAHHLDYSKPLEVEWLCHRCHRAEHGRLISVQPAKEGALP